MNRVAKTLKNGYYICEVECYTGCDIRHFWAIWSPTGQHYMNCVSYNEAYEIASHLAGKEN